MLPGGDQIRGEIDTVVVRTMVRGDTEEEVVHTLVRFNSDGTRCSHRGDVARATQAFPSDNDTTGWELWGSLSKFIDTRLPLLFSSVRASPQNPPLYVCLWSVDYPKGF